MSKLLAMSVAAIMALSPVLAVAAAPAGNGTPSSKAATAINTVTVCQTTSTPTTGCSSADNTWMDVMETTIKTSNVADLFVGVSLVTGLFTSTQVFGRNDGKESTATAMGGVAVRVILDGGTNTSFPDSGNGVTFDQRIQTLTATLGDVFTNCTTCTLTPEQITLVLDTTSAHTYNYILLNVGSGVHTLKVQAQININATGSGPNLGVAISHALFGLGSLTVDAVRLVNSFSF